MDPKGTNPYSTEIPVTEAEKELKGPALALPVTPPVPTSIPTPQSKPTDPTPPAAPPPSQPPEPNTPPPSPLAKKPSFIPKIIIGALVTFIVLLTAYIVTARMGGSKTPPQAAVKPTAIPTPTSLPTATPTPIQAATTSADQSSNRFYSTELGLYFDYAKILPVSQNQTAQVEADGTRVYVYIGGTVPTQGQYVDVLSKITTDSTLQAVDKITVNDPNYAGCTFSLKSQTIYPSTYEQIVPTCPPQPGSGSTFFLGDSLHPDKLLFFSIGQYGIPASSNPQLLWHDTLRFL